MFDPGERFMIIHFANMDVRIWALGSQTVRLWIARIAVY